MNWTLHERAMALVDEGRYAEAAEIEEKAVDCVPSGLPRTLGILAQSAVSMWMKAGNDERAKRFFENVRKRLTVGWETEIEALITNWRTDG